MILSCYLEKVCKVVRIERSPHSDAYFFTLHVFKVVVRPITNTVTVLVYPNIIIGFYTVIHDWGLVNTIVETYIEQNKEKYSKLFLLNQNEFLYRDPTIASSRSISNTIHPKKGMESIQSM